MKKIKLLIASMIGAIALVFSAVFGAKINAKTVSSSFSFSSNLPELAKYENNTAATANVSATDGDTNESLTLSVYNYFTGGTIKYDSGKYLNRKSTSPSEYAEFVFTTKGTGKLTLKSFTTQSDSKKAGFILNCDDEEVVNEVAAIKGKDKEFTLAEAGTYSLKITGDSTQSSNISFTEMIITDTYDDGQAEAEKFDVSYNNNGHGSSVSAVNVSELLTSNLPVLSEIGFEFGGWFYDNETFNNEAKVGDLITEDTVLYAKWTAVASYTVTYNVDGKITSSNVNEGTIITLSAAPTKANAVFKGWSNGSTTYKAGASYTVSSDVTFIATWTTFVAGDGTSFDGSDLYNVYPATIDNEMIVDGTIFTIYADSSKTVTLDGNKMTLSDDTTEITGRVKLGGTADFTNTLRVIGFTAPNNGTINVEFATASSSSTRSLVLKDSNGTEIISVSSANDKKTSKLVAEVEAGKTYYFGSASSGINISQVQFIEASQLADNTTASVFAEKATINEDLVVRFVGTITGINALDDIDSIELVLKKDGVATKSQIFLTTCYTSVTGASQTCAAADGTFYVIFRITEATSLTGSKISSQLIVTFTDGSTTTSEVVEKTIA